MFGIDTISKAIDTSKEVLGKILPSLSEAWNAAKETKDKGFLDRIGMFFSKFKEEYDKLGKEKEQISQDAQDAAKQTTEQAMTGATAAVKLDESKVEKTDADAYKEALASGVASLKSLSPEQQAFAGKGFDKVKKAMKEGGEDHLDLDEFKAVAATGLSTLKALKTKYPDKEKLTAALTQISKASDSSEYPVAGLLKASVLKVLKPSVGDMISSPLKAKAFAEAFGIEISINLLPPTIESPFKDAMVLMKEKELAGDNKAKVVEAYGKYIIPHTNKTDVNKVVQVVDFVHNIVITQPEQLSTDQMAELVSLVDSEDLDRIIAIFTGKTENAANVA